MSFYPAFYRNVLLPGYDQWCRGRSTLKYWSQAEKSQWLSRKELESRQFVALRSLVQYAWDSCPYYRQKWEVMGLHPDRLRSIVDFGEWPVIKRDDVRQNRMQMRTVLEKGFITKSTGGSTGEPIVFDLSFESNERRTALAIRGYGWAGCYPGTRRVLIWGDSLNEKKTWRKWKVALHRWVENQLLLSCFDFSPDDYKTKCDQIHRFGPEVIVAYTNPVYELSEFILRQNLSSRSLKSVIVGAEKLYDFQRQSIETAFKTRVFETYGSREFMLIGGECELHQGLHLSIDNLHVEILDDDGQPTAPGSVGNVVITDLHNRAMPFIRYVIGDRAIAGFDDCKCGRGLPLLKGIEGRRLDMLQTPEGNQISGALFPHFFKDYRCVQRFQVVQNSFDRWTVKLVLESNTPQSSVQQMQTNLRNSIVSCIRLDWEFLEDIPLTKSGKRQVVIHMATEITQR